MCGHEEEFDDIDSAEDVDYEWERRYGSTNVELYNPGGCTEYYNHVCEGCTEDISYCERCDIQAHSDNGYYCDEFVCDDCAEEAHEIWRDENPEMFNGRECSNCGYEPARPLIDRYAGKPLVTL